MTKGIITADLTLLDVVSDFPATEKVFKRYDEQFKACICCEMLFADIAQVAEKYGLNLGRLLQELNSATAPDNESC